MRDLAAPRHQSRRVRQAAAIDIFRREESRDAVQPLGIETVTHEMRTPSRMAAASASDAGSIARSAALAVSRSWSGLLAPTIALVMSGRDSPHAIANCHRTHPALSPNRFRLVTATIHATGR